MALSHQMNLDGMLMDRNMGADTLKQDWIEIVKSVTIEPRNESSSSSVRSVEASMTSNQGTELTTQSSGRTTNDVEAFWGNELTGASQTNFPRYRSRERPVPRAYFSRFVRVVGAKQPAIRLPTVLQAAWALLNARLSDSNDVVFGAYIGKGLAVESPSSKVEEAKTAVPLRAQFDSSWTVPDFLYKMEQKWQNIIEQPNLGLKGIQHLSDENKDACDIHNLLAVYGSEKFLPAVDEQFRSSQTPEIALLVECTLERDGFMLQLSYDEDIMPSQQTKRLAAQFEHVLLQVCNAREDIKLEDIEFISPAEKRELWDCNRMLPSVVDRCIHSLVASATISHRDKAAIYSWDGELSYGELDTLSTRLANTLNARGVGPEVFVGLCFEKSKWYVVAMVAILKAGGAFVPLDPAHPATRLRNMIGDVRATLVLTDAEHQRNDALKGIMTIVVDATLSGLASELLPMQERVRPQNAAYALFTSGTTGRPKAFVIEHQAYCSSATARRDVILRTSRSRVLQFASYTFDPSVEDILTTLMVGGCICIPSEYERLNDVAGFINRSGANFANLTPAFATFLTPEKVPSLEVLLLSGETMLDSHVQTWAHSVKLMNGYGPSECCIKVAVNPSVTAGSEPSNIGFPIGCLLWIMEPSNPERFAPIGAVGELLVEGPSLARGYLQPTPGASSGFIENPQWLVKARHGQRTRLYRTGDLVRQNADGSLTFIGRKDKQVKIRGQRVELAEIEVCLRNCLPSLIETRVEVCTLNDKSEESLVAFLKLGKNHESIQAVVSTLRKQLPSILPGYMVPVVYIPVEQIPVTINGKTDRKELRDIAKRFQLDGSTPPAVRQDFASNLSENERQMQMLWASVLDIHPGSIGPTDNFFWLRSADSFTAIKLASAARAGGLQLSVQEIFKHPTLRSMTTVAQRKDKTELASIKPFKLLPPGQSQELLDHARLQCQLEDTQIADIYPCTPLQSGLMAFSIKNPGSFIGQYTFPLPVETDLPRFQSAWTRVARETSMLRTSLAYTDSSDFLQVVSSEDIEWNIVEAKSLETYLKEDKTSVISFGQPLTRYTIVKEGSHRKATFVWTAHHAAYDRWSLSELCHQVEAVYHGSNPSPQAAFNTFVDHTLSLDCQNSQDYWAQQLLDAPISAFFASKQPQATLPDESLQADVQFTRHPRSEFTLSTLIRTAWALVLAQYEKSNDVVFGATLSGRSGPVAGIDHILGPTITTVPVRVRFDLNSSPAQLLEAIQAQAHEMIDHEQLGIARIKGLNEDANTACQFQSLLLIQSSEPSKSSSTGFYLDLERVNAGIDDYLSYPLTLECTPNTDGMRVHAVFSSAAVDPRQMRRILRQMEHVLQQLCQESHDGTIQDLEMIPPGDVEEIMKWNKELPASVEDSVSQMVERRVAQQPRQPAIESWDGSLSYRDLDDLSNLLAGHLIDAGVGPEVHVPFCFEKSLWAVVAMLGVLKAGGVCVALDPNHPLNRRQTIIDMIGAKVALASVSHAELLQGSVLKVITVSERFFKRDFLESRGNPVKILIRPESAAFVVFTSGSTGVPKGISLENRVVCTSALAHGSVMRLGPKSRVLQFAAYTFDVSIGDIFTTLIHGGCVCIPSDSDRMNDLAGACRSLKVNQAYLTTTVAASLFPDEVPDLKTLSVGGEAVTEAVIRQWADRVYMINIYGPAECTVWCAGKAGISKSEHPENIGKGIGALLWITDIADHNALAPIGVLGELLVEGPILARCYIKDPAKTAAAFIENPAWATSTVSTTRRFYKTGDLGRYATDGSLHVIGRKDTQTKIRGQRVEMGEVEEAVRKSLPDATKIVAEAANPANGPLALVVFLLLGNPSNTTGDTNILVSDSKDISNFKDALQGLESRLSEILPRYMVPSLFIPLRRLPLSVSGKTDRKKLRETLSRLSPERLLSFSRESSRGRAPETKEQIKLCALWGAVLKIPEDSISADDNFFRISGDSIAAMRLVASARNAGLKLTVADIFKSPVLADMASVAISIKSAKRETMVPFDLVGDMSTVNDLRDEAATQCNVNQDLIEDIYPCAPLQEGLMALSIKEPGTYMAQFAYKLPASMDAREFVQSWDKLIESTPILRSRFIYTTSLRFMQVVLRKSTWCTTKTEDLQSFLERDKKDLIRLGDPLMRFTLVRDLRSNVSHIVWTAHHASYDGWTLRHILSRVQELYRNDTVHPQKGYNNFIRYLEASKSQDSSSYWETELSGAEAPSFPAMPNPSFRPIASDYIRYDMKLAKTAGAEFTLSTEIRAAWALLLSQYETSTEVIFGTILSGRTIPVDDIEDVMGPTFTTVPIRLRTEKNQKINDFLTYVQQQNVEMMPHEHTGLQNISTINSDCRIACNFRNILVIQAAEGSDQAIANAGLGLEKVSTGIDDFLNYGLAVECTLGTDTVMTQISYDPAVMEVSQAELLARQLEHILQQIHSLSGAEESMKLSDVDLLSKTDRELLTDWNSQAPLRSDTFIHQLVEKQVSAQPNREAICSWDGNLTYRELDGLSTNLAAELLHHGVGPDILVPICFEKSTWAVVTLLAILKAGGAFVPMDPSQPASRLRDIVALTSAKLVCVSPQTFNIFEDLDVELVTVSRSTVAQTSRMRLPRKSRTSSSNLAYVIFTSGSTGIPKGVMIEHGSISTSLIAHGKVVGFSSTTRCLQFASYAFDVSVAEIFTTLTFGGCICIASDLQRRNNIAQAMKEMDVNLACFTPTFVKSLVHSDVPTLKTLIMGGEAIGRDTIDYWSTKLRLVNGYGPTEACVLSVAQHVESPECRTETIGNAVGAIPWIVDPNDHSRPLPIGTVGELLLEGPILARGYYNDTEKTEAMFITGKDMLSTSSMVKETRYYKTGDLVRFGVTGLLEFVGRKDTQVKVNGQRVELSEIEHQFRICMPSVTDLAVEVVRHKDRDNSQAIAAYFVSPGKNQKEPTDSLLKLDDNFTNTLRALKSALSRVLPAYMVPTMYIPMGRLPISTSEKVDRKKLQAIVNNLSLEEYSYYSLVDHNKAALTTPIEEALQILWMETLSLKAEAIGGKDSFFHAGGDSISAMKLVALARNAGYQLSVEDVFRYPVLAEMASIMGSSTDQVPAALEPFELVDSLDSSELQEEAAVQCNVSADFVEDVYPCTPLQDGFMTLSVKEPGFGVAQFTWLFPETLDASKFREAWSTVTENTPILRTRILQLVRWDSLMQVVLKSSSAPSWTIDNELAIYLDFDINNPMGLGDELVRYALVNGPRGRYFVLTIHHSVYDGWMLELILKQVEQVYLGLAPQVKSTEFNKFIQYLEEKDQDESKNYWERQLHAALPPVFPVLPNPMYRGSANKELSYTIALAPPSSSNITLSTKIRAAWALLTARYSDTDDVVFASTLSGRTAPVPGIDTMVGPTVATVPVRIRCNNDQNIGTFLEAVQAQSVEMMAHIQYGTQNIRRINDECNAACQFLALLLIQSPAEGEQTNEILGLQSVRDGSAAFHTYPLSMECTIQSPGITLRVGYDVNVVDSAQMQRIFYQFEHILFELENTNRRIDEIDLISPQDVLEIRGWNKDVPAPLNKCVHELVEARAKLQPNDPAVCSFDGDLTYKKLDGLATKLSISLRKLGIESGVLVPLVFEKSMWTIVTMLAVLKAGGANVALDPSHPVDRLRGIIEDTEATIILSSRSYLEKARQLLDSVVPIDAAEIDALHLRLSRSREPSGHKAAKPESPAFILFSSGSTGKPKGIIIDHVAFSSSINGHAEILRYRRGGRNLQFTAYTSDVSIGEIFTSLSVGSCVCVPSDFERMNCLPQAMERMQVDWAFLTPSVASLYKPQEVPTLKTLLFGGETATPENISTWAGSLFLINSFGPAECSIWTHCNPGHTLEDVGSNIGYAIGCVTWITDPLDYNRLAPIGAVGELLVEGPNIAQGYLKNPEKTAAAFVENPAWMPDDGRRHRLYRMGDLVRYMPDGRIQFIGRRDTQIKLRGQRIELGEIEHQLRKSIPDLTEIAVEMVKLAGKDAPNMLAAFMSLDQGEKEVIATTPESMALFAQLIDGLDVKLPHLLPHHMIPTLYIPLERMPLTASAKTDRKQLRLIASKIPLENMGTYSGSSRERRPITTDEERRMCEFWAQALHLEPLSIFGDDSFFKIGGDSVAAMRLVAIVREAGFRISVQSIFQNRLLYQMAKVPESVNQAPICQISAFSLLGEYDVLDVSEQVAAQCQVEDVAVEDIYPCTPLQEGLIAVSTKASGAYVAQFVFQLPVSINLVVFKDAWASVVKSTQILRTRFAQVESYPGILQAVIAESVDWVHASNLKSYLKADSKETMNLGQPLSRYAIVDDTKGERHFVLTAHHAVYDLRMLQLLSKKLEQAYFGKTSDSSPKFDSFIKYLQDRDNEAGKAFWAKQLEDSPAGSFPSGNEKARAVESENAEHSIKFNGKAGSDTTPSTIIRAAWALVLGRYLDAKDVVFGTTISGRACSLPGVGEIVAPTIATVPIRVTFDDNQGIPDLLRQIQSQYVEMIEHEQFGLQNIRRVSEHARVACNFKNLLVIQNRRDPGDGDDFIHLRTDVGQPNTFGGLPFIIECSLGAASIDIKAGFDPSMIAKPQVERLLALFAHTVTQLSLEQNVKISDLELVTPLEKEEILERNNRLPLYQNITLHRAIGQQMKAQPRSEAICSENIKLSYAQLDQLSHKLSQLMIKLGVGPEILVPICFEKSALAIVAMMGVLRAGGAIVPMDPSHPRSRVAEIISQVSARIVITSPQTSQLFEGLDLSPVELSLSMLERLPVPGAKTVAWKDSTSSNAAYAIFTSGSSGKPKGVVVEHGQICSSIAAHGPVIGFGPETRILQFASYTFDVAIAEIFTTLSFGGCICIASDDERRNDPAKAMRQMGVTYACFTPSFMKSIQPANVPSLKVLILGGEALRQDIIDTWVDHVRLFNGYGPTEACVLSVAHRVERHSKPEIIGHTVGAVPWIVHPEDHDKLVHSGMIGELLLEGPILARGYLNDQRKTDDAFVQNLAFMPRDGQQHRMYKTGDLVLYNSDGLLEFVGRKDSQIKFHGQRIELGEIEHQIKLAQPDLVGLGIEIVKPTVRGGNEAIAAFLCYQSSASDSDSAMEDLVLSLSPQMTTTLLALVNTLSKVIPTYMIPSLYVPMKSLPSSTSGKLDRKKLRTFITGRSLAELEGFSLRAGEKTSVKTTEEQQMRQLWKKVLGIDEDSIGAEDDFFGLGGDSIAAMQLVAAARGAGLKLSVEDIFKTPILSNMTKTSAVMSAEDVAEVAPFSLIEEGSSAEIMRYIASVKCGIGEEYIEDIYPTTSSQETFMRYSKQVPGSTTMQHVFELPAGLSLAKFRAAWEITVASHAVLRTRIIQYEGTKMLQVVSREPVVWKTASSVKSYLVEDKKDVMGYGKPLNRCGIVQGKYKNTFIWTVNHAVYDAWSTRLVLGQLENFLEFPDMPHEEIKFNKLIKHTSNLNREDAQRFWRAEFQDISTNPLFVENHEWLADTLLDHEIAVPQPTIPGTSKVTLLQAAWGMVLARNTLSDDVVLNVTLTGRNARIVGIEEMVAPTLSVVPVRINPHSEQSVQEYLDSIQQSMRRIVPYEQTGKDIILGSGKDAESALAAAVPIVIHPSNPYKDKMVSRIGLSHTTTNMLASRPIAFGIDCSVSDTGYEIYVVFNNHIIKKGLVQCMAYQLEHVLQQLAASDGSNSLGSLSLDSSRHRAKIKMHALGKGMNFANADSGMMGGLMGWMRQAASEFVSPKGASV